MANRNSARGSLFENATLRYLRAAGKDAERLARTGAEDEGDISVRTVNGLTVLELKATKAMDISAALREAELEAGHYAKHRGLTTVPRYFAVMKAPGKPIGRAYVVTYLENWIQDN